MRRKKFRGTTQIARNLLSPAAFGCFNAAITSCFSQAAREAKFTFGDNGFLAPTETLSEMSYPKATETQS